MCFSATASFSASAILGVAGVITLKNCKSSNQEMFGSIPFVFAIQQLLEGILWVTIGNPDYGTLSQFSMYGFLFFAQILWPIWVPLSIILLIKKDHRNIIHYLLLLIGVTVAGYLAYCLATFGVTANIEGHHVLYVQDYPHGKRKFVGAFYIIATVFPTLFCRIKRMWLLSVTIFISYVLAAIFYEYYVVSVWCFFSSIISLAVYVVINNLQNIGDNKFKDSMLESTNYNSPLKNNTEKHSNFQ